MAEDHLAQPTPLEEHRKLKVFAGEWAGEEMVHPSRWTSGGPATSQVAARIDLNGFYLIQDTRQMRDGKESFATHAVFTYDLSKPFTDDMKPVDTITLPEVRIAGRSDHGGAVANWVTFSNDGQIYISNSGMRSVTAIDMKAKKINAVVPVGEVPKRINTLVLK